MESKNSNLKCHKYLPVSISAETVQSQSGPDFMSIRTIFISIDSIYHQPVFSQCFYELLLKSPL